VDGVPDLSLGTDCVVPALLILNAPFGFVALLGVIALSGMIMCNRSAPYAAWFRLGRTAPLAA
jgi:hypothetical protein